MLLKSSQMKHLLQGLEFDDVFLVDFFADSPATAEWRVLLSYLEELSLDEASDNAKVSPAIPELRTSSATSTPQIKSASNFPVGMRAYQYPG